MTTSDEPMQTNEDTLEGSELASASAASSAHLPPDALEHEVHGGDNESVIEDSPSSTESITSTSSLWAYRTIHERTYHSERWSSEYCFPIDQLQLEVEEYAHNATVELFQGKLHVADLKRLKQPVQRALDVGSGRGFWAIDFADDHPSIEVTGTDLSPIAEEWVPPNLRFEIEDCTGDWSFDEACFGFIHLRSLSGGIKDWKHVFHEAYRCTITGGLVESHEPSFRIKSDSGSIKPLSPLARMGDLFRDVGSRTGCSFTIMDDDTQRKLMEEAGFVIIEDEVKRMPIGGKRQEQKFSAGWLAYKALLEDLEGRLLYPTTQVLKWPEERTRLIVALVKEQLMTVDDMYVEHHIVVGQKPWGGSG